MIPPQFISQEEIHLYWEKLIQLETPSSLFLQEKNCGRWRKSEWFREVSCYVNILQEMKTCQKPPYIGGVCRMSDLKDFSKFSKELSKI